MRVRGTSWFTGVRDVEERSTGVKFHNRRGIMIAAAPTTANLVSSNPKSSHSNNEQLLNDENVVEVMRRKLGTKDFRIKHWSLDPVSGTNGFLGQYFNLRVTCEDNTKVPKKYAFFAKAKPMRNSPQFELSERNDLFNKEIRVYEDLIPRMGYGAGNKWSVDCYLGKKDVIIVLEDATIEGYAMPNKYVPFSLDQCNLMLSSLASLHARSLIFDENLRRRHGKTILDVYGDIFVEALFPSEDRSDRNIIDPGLDGIGAMIDLLDDFDDSTKRRIKSRIRKWCWTMPRLLRSSAKYRNVVCHRDPWANNFMMKCDASGRPIGWYLIDFQFLCYVPPAIDFMISLYLNTNRKMRDELFETLAKTYYACFKKELDSAGLEIKSFLSWNEFRESCEAYRALGIIYATINMQIMLLNGEIADKYFSQSPELLDRVLWGSERAEMVCPMFTKVKEYRERMTENIMEINERLADDPPET